MKIEITKLVSNEKYCKEVFDFFVKKQIIKKTSPDLFVKYLKKSVDNLDFANFILSEHQLSIKKKLPNRSFYDWCIAIYYYSLYHSISALIAKAGLESKNHLASIATLTFIYYHKKNVLKKEDIEFIIENLNLNREEIEFIGDSKDLREKANYKVDENFDLMLAKDMQKKTANFVNKIKEILHEV